MSFLLKLLELLYFKSLIYIFTTLPMSFIELNGYILVIFYYAGKGGGGGSGI